jgi:hypothetical protein
LLTRTFVDIKGETLMSSNDLPSTDPREERLESLSLPLLGALADLRSELARAQSELLESGSPAHLAAAVGKIAETIGGHARGWAALQESFRRFA